MERWLARFVASHAFKAMSSTKLNLLTAKVVMIKHNVNSVGVQTVAIAQTPHFFLLRLRN